MTTREQRDWMETLANCEVWRARALAAGDVQGARTAESIIRLCRLALAQIAAEAAAGGG